MVASARPLNLETWCADHELLTMCRGLEPLVTEWTETVELGGWERGSNHLDMIRSSLGEMPDASNPNQRALWIAALINPLPPLVCVTDADHGL